MSIVLLRNKNIRLLELIFSRTFLFLMNYRDYGLLSVASMGGMIFYAYCVHKTYFQVMIYLSTAGLSILVYI